jgi:hypothetical protein
MYLRCRDNSRWLGPKLASRDYSRFELRRWVCAARPRYCCQDRLSSCSRADARRRCGARRAKDFCRASDIHVFQWWAETFLTHSDRTSLGAEWLTSPRLRMPIIRLLLLITGNLRTFSASMCRTALRRSTDAKRTATISSHDTPERQPCCFRLERLPGGVCTHWKAPPCHGAHPKRSLANANHSRPFRISPSHGSLW